MNLTANISVGSVAMSRSRKSLIEVQDKVHFRVVLRDGRQRRDLEGRRVRGGEEGGEGGEE